MDLRGSGSGGAGGGESVTEVGKSPQEALASVNL